MCDRRWTCLGALFFLLLGLSLSGCSAGKSQGQPDGDEPTDGDTPTDGDATPDGDDPTDGDEWNLASEFTVVEVGPETSATIQLAVQACAGLYNRELGGSIFVQTDANDAQWLEELGLEPKDVVNAPDFLDACIAKFPACVRYSYDDQRLAMPSILTIASVLGAVPLDTGMNTSCSEVAFDAITELAQKDTPYLATQYVFENYVVQTTGLAMLNPGYEIWENNMSSPALTRDMPPSLVDLVFSKKLFALFLVNGCRDENLEKELLHKIVNAGHWPTPLGVYGYNNSWMVMGGFYYEAQTKCLDSRNMGAIPSETSNLSFFSTRRPPIRDVSELERNETEDIEYDPTKTYVAFVIGDGDNIAFIMSTRKSWLRHRLSDCEQTGQSCSPITWSISPHLPHLAPDVLAWYYKSARRTGKDYFTLPPSGHLYAYPTSLNEEDQDRFVAATEEDARILGVSGVVHWDWIGTWEDAEKDFLPKYAREDGVIRGVFPINVPYLFDAFPWWEDGQFFKVLVGKDGGKVVVFRPRQWRGIDNDSDIFFLSPQKMAEELGSYPPGTVTWVYMTSDGGLSLENSFMELERIMPSHVKLVSTDAAARLALISGRK